MSRTAKFAATPFKFHIRVKTQKFAHSHARRLTRTKHGTKRIAFSKQKIMSMLSASVDLHRVYINHELNLT